MQEIFIITARRVYVYDHFTYKILVNITGKWENEDLNASANDLEKSLPQSGLTYVKYLDNFTVLAEVTSNMESQLPVAIVYKKVYFNKR